MLQLIAGTAVVCYIWKARPSTLLRIVEDAAIRAPKAVAQKAKRFGKAVHIEYEARMIDRAQAAIAKEQAKLRSLSPEELKALARDQETIFARAEELQALREGKPVTFKAPKRRGVNNKSKAPRASHASS